MKDCVVLGNGFLAQAFEAAGYDIIKGFRYNNFFDNFNYLDSFLKGKEFLINCIAKTDVKWCEENAYETYDVNVKFPLELDKYLALHGVKLIQISSGCVYGQHDAPVNEETPPRPRGVYVTTKYLADEILKDRALILRPRLLYSDNISHPKNLVDRLKLFSRATIDLNSITSCEEIVVACEKLKGEIGIYNLASEVTSIFEFSEKRSNFVGKKIPVLSSNLYKVLPDKMKGIYPNVVLNVEKYRKASKKV